MPRDVAGLNTSRDYQGEGGGYFSPCLKYKPRHQKTSPRVLGLPRATVQPPEHTRGPQRDAASFWVAHGGGTRTCEVRCVHASRTVPPACRAGLQICQSAERVRPKVGHKSSRAPGVKPKISSTARKPTRRSQTPAGLTPEVGLRWMLRATKSSAAAVPCGAAASGFGLVRRAEMAESGCERTDRMGAMGDLTAVLATRRRAFLIQ